ncbi:hypothetical protein NDU88_007834 [Pleurodeles waltl]|uniref:Uncharacterized protein n=1 Tax=Pleurodeles waltl TaxID=8319 RepID=A0AAV7N361_PLEWA|nr:hypothetical protein NDU88_007834 [Pleurodeles waltl]
MGARRHRTTHRVRCPSTLTTAATRNHVRGPRRSGTQGRKLATRPIRPDKRGGVASSEDRGRRARSGKEQAEQAAGTAGAVTTRIHLPTTPTNTRGPSTPHRETGRRSKGVRPLRQPGEKPGQRERNHGPFRIDQHEIRITANYSKETNERRKAFLALRPRLRKLEMKYGLFDPARMWVTKNGVSKDFYNPDELRLFLDSFQPQPMDSLNTDSEHDIVGGSDRAETPHSGIEKVKTALHDTGDSHRGRDMERLTRSYDDRGQILHAVVTHTQLSERDKSRSPLKPTTGSS